MIERKTEGNVNFQFHAKGWLWTFKMKRIRRATWSIDVIWLHNSRFAERLIITIVSKIKIDVIAIYASIDSWPSSSNWEISFNRFFCYFQNQLLRNLPEFYETFCALKQTMPEVDRNLSVKGTWCKKCVSWSVFVCLDTKILATMETQLYLVSNVLSFLQRRKKTWIAILPSIIPRNMLSPVQSVLFAWKSSRVSNFFNSIWGESMEHRQKLGHIE